MRENWGGPAQNGRKPTNKQKRNDQNWLITAKSKYRKNSGQIYLSAPIQNVNTPYKNVAHVQKVFTHTLN